MPWLFHSYLYCCDLDDKLLFKDNSACGFVHSTMTTAFCGSLDVCVLPECNFREVGWVWAVTVVVSWHVRSAAACAEPLKSRGTVAGGMSSLSLDDLDDFQKKKMASTSKPAAGLFDPFLNVNTNIKLLQFRENILACCLLGAHVIWSIYLFIFLEHTHCLFGERLYIGWRSTGNSRDSWP